MGHHSRCQLLANAAIAASGVLPCEAQRRSQCRRRT